MKEHRFSRRLIVRVVIGLGIAGAVAGFAVAQIPGANGVIHGCYSQWGGAIRLAGEGRACKTVELRISWKKMRQLWPLSPGGDSGPGGPVRSSREQGQMG